MEAYSMQGRDLDLYIWRVVLGCNVSPEFCKKYMWYKCCWSLSRILEMCVFKDRLESIQRPKYRQLATCVRVVL